MNTTFQATALLGPGIIRPTTETPAVGIVALHWFGELVKIAGASKPWTGGDLAAFIKEVPHVIHEKRVTGELDPRALILVLNWNEHPQTYLNDTRACYLWMRYGVQALHECTGLPVGCFDPFMLNDVANGLWHHHALFDYLSPDIYPQPCKVRPIVRVREGVADLDWYVNQLALPRLQACATGGQPMLTFCSPTYFMDKTPVEPWLWRLQVGLAKRFGDVAVYNEVKDQAQMDAVGHGFGEVV